MSNIINSINSLLENSSLNLELKGWPATISIASIGLTIVAVTKLTHDNQITNDSYL